VDPEREAALLAEMKIPKDRGTHAGAAVVAGRVNVELIHLGKLAD
jgi:hypothetical protein